MPAVNSSDPDQWSTPEIVRAILRIQSDMPEMVHTIRTDMQAGFAALNTRLDGVVSQGVYAADRRLLEQQISDLRADLAAKKTAHEHDMGTERAERERIEERLMSELRTVEERRQRLLYMLAVPSILSVITIVVMIWTSRKGG